MDEKTLKQLQKKLLQMKDEVKRLIDSEENPDKSDTALDEIDKATESSEMELGSLMSSNLYSNLKSIEDALKKIDKNEYGKCEVCGQEISVKRLQTIPFATHCVDCQKDFENAHEPQVENTNFDQF